MLVTVEPDKNLLHSDRKSDANSIFDAVGDNAFIEMLLNFMPYMLIMVLKKPTQFCMWLEG